jgi:DNA-binding CsgD family transcriptional regulator/tetratricopeptide (TPR) repeat protein
MPPSEPTDDEPRLTMLVTLREFAAEQLKQHEEAMAAQRAHAAYYLHLVEEIAPRLFGPEQKSWLDRLELEHDNLRAALHWALEQDETETALRLGSGLGRFWLLRGYLSEGNRWLSLLLDKVELILVSTELKARVFHAAGLLAMYQGNFRRAEALCNESLTLCRQRADKAGIATALQALAQVAMRAGQFTTARAMREESLAIGRELGNQWGIANNLVYLGLIDWMEGVYPAAQPRLEEGLACYRAVGDPQAIAQALQSLGWVALSLDDVNAAQALVEESLAICRTLRDRAGMARSLTALGMVALRQDNLTQTQALLNEALPIVIELGDKFHIASCLGIMTMLAVAVGQPMRAAQMYSVTEAFMETLGAAKPAFFNTHLERSLEAARLQLDEESFAAALAEGRSMTPEQILVIQPLVPQQPGDESVASASNFPAGLTQREVEVLRLLAQGLTNAQIAEHLIVSPYTVNAHLRHIFNKLDVPTRAAATRYAIEHHLI